MLFDQSHHMAELTVKGPDALKLISYTTINSFNNFSVNKAKQMVPISYDGYVIGDGILFYLDKDELLFVGRAPTVNWLQFHAETGGFKVDMIRDDRSPSHPRGNAVVRRHYRYQVQGPNAEKVLEQAERRPDPGREVLHDGCINIRRQEGPRPASRHGRRAGTGDLGSVRGARVHPRRDPRRRAKSSASCRSARAPTRATRSSRAGFPRRCPPCTPARSMKKYREWLPAGGYEATGSIGGSFVSDKIEDYYVTPYELGYGPFVKFDHDFIGREALEKMVEGQAAAA